MKLNYIYISAILLITILFLSGCSKQTAQTPTPPQAQQAGPVKCNDPPCLSRYFPTCTPAEMSMSSEGQTITVTIHGFENEKCHYTMVFGDVTAANCYFKKEDLNGKVLNQMFGNKEGQDAIIAEACKQ